MFQFQIILVTFLWLGFTTATNLNIDNFNCETDPASSEASLGDGFYIYCYFPNQSIDACIWKHCYRPGTCKSCGTGPTISIGCNIGWNSWYRTDGCGLFIASGMEYEDFGTFYLDVIGKPENGLGIFRTRKTIEVNLKP